MGWQRTTRRRGVSARYTIAAWCVAVLAPCLAAGQANPPAKKSDVQTITFNHVTDTEGAYELKLRNGETFQILIKQTCESAFTYDIRGFLRATSAAPVGPVVNAGGPPLADKVIPVIHDSKYGGYILTIAPSEHPIVCSGEGADKLRARTLIISTPLVDWDLSFSGGFTVSNLVSPVYSLQPHPTAAGKMQVKESSDQEDAVKLGFASFVHIYHTRHPSIAPMFGLGIREDNKTEFFLGLGYRFSDSASLNGGIAWGPVSRLPNGVNTTDPVSDNNVLTNLPTRTAKGVFVAISYSFLHVRDRLEKPFAGDNSAAGAGGGAAQQTTQGGGNENAAGCKPELEKVSVALKPAGEIVKVKVPTLTPAGCALTITKQASWAPVTYDADKKELTIVAEPNTQAASRTQQVSVGSATLTLTQDKQ